MDDYIRREAAIDAIDKRVQFLKDDPVFRRKHGDIDLYGIKPIIRALPSAQPERIKGRWISADAIFGGEPFYCSECGENTRDTVMGKPRWNFCPNCGADMRPTERDSNV